MAAAYRGRAEHSGNERETSPARAAVVYYLSRNGHLEHPHFMEVPLSSSSGLYLRDVINRLHVLRGRAMVGMYSWSSKRSYRNGYVWQDLSEDDFIHPFHGSEYVLKGTELLHLNSPSSSYGSQEPSLSSSTSSKCVQEDSAASFSRRKHATGSSFYKSNTSAETTASSTDASTQTEEHNKQQRRAPVAEVKRAENPKSVTVAVKHAATELGRDEVSPPPSSSSTETLEALIKADGRCIMAVRPEEKGWSVGGCLSGRVKASAVLMHLISCGSISAKANGLSLMPQYSGRRLDRAESMGHMPSFRSMSLEEEKEEFTSKMGDDGELPPVLKKSSSYNADRGSKMNLAKEVEDDRARCMPRKAKTRKERKPHK